MTKRNPWLRVGLDAWSLGLEASSVIGLWALRISAGGRRAEAEGRMIGEKVQAAWALQAVAMSGGLGLTALSAAAKAIFHYQQRVRADRRRLAK